MSKYKWKFASIGGQTRVSIDNGADLVNLKDLDKKLWTVLSCPVDGLETDRRTLELLDSDSDGKIRVNEVVEASQWLSKVLRSPEVLTARKAEIALDAIDPDTVEGAQVLNSARRVLDSIGTPEKQSISISDTSDSISIFAKTRFNGDGVIAPASTDEQELKDTISAAVSCTGGTTDRSGETGIDSVLLDRFYSECADYAEWCEAGLKSEIHPYGDDTPAALEAYEALKEKVEDFFVRCSLLAFDSESAGSLDASVSRISDISSRNLALCDDEIAKLPLARINAKGVVDPDEVNPSWKAVFSKFVSIVSPKAGKFTREEWNEAGEKLAPYAAWKAGKKGTCAEPLGIEAAKAFAAASRKDDLLALIAKDKELESEFAGIQTLEKLLLLCRDFFGFVRNYVSMTDFYAGQKAVFQAGRLYIDQRSCDLCIKVSDMGKSTASAGKSGMFLLYCTCVSKKAGNTLNIVAVMTDGDVNDLFEGKNAIFYDRNGEPYDAVVTKIVDNPISVRQAFWAPYRKLGKFVSDKIAKKAADKDAEATAKLLQSADAASLVPSDATQEKKAPFDIAKFAGIFAAIGMAVGYISKALVDIAHGIAATAWWKVIIVIAAILLIISGPSMFLAYLKLRKRNLAPVLNANGWAVNSQIFVSILFGQTLTSIASLPLVKIPVQKPKCSGVKIAVIAALAALAVFAALFFTGCLAGIGLPFPR